MSYEVIRWIK